MSAAVLERPRELTAETVGDGGQATLGDVLSTAWEGLVAHRTVGCPVCGGEMAPRYGASGMTPVGGRCGSCQTTLG
jgi:hypothetical protein